MPKPKPLLTQEEFDGLREEVIKFDCMALPGQPQMMHMGTSYLVNRLWKALKLYHDQATKEPKP